MTRPAPRRTISKFFRRWSRCSRTYCARSSAICSRHCSGTSRRICGRGENVSLAMRREGANHRWRKIPPGELSIDLEADGRLGRISCRSRDVARAASIRSTPQCACLPGSGASKPKSRNVLSRSATYHRCARTRRPGSRVPPRSFLQCRSPEVAHDFSYRAEAIYPELGA
jgi:hypothetical protein